MSRSASSRTMLADLPPSSRVTGFTVPEASCMMRRPTSVEPVNAVLSTMRVDGELLADGAAGAGDDVDDAGREVGLLERPRRASSAVIEVNDAGLSTSVVAGGEGRGDLPGRHDEREVPRDDAGAHAVGLVADVVLRRRERASPGSSTSSGAPRRSLANHRNAPTRAGHVGERRLLDGAAAVAGLDLGELLGLGLDELGDLVELARPRSLPVIFGHGPSSNALRAASMAADGVLAAGLGDLADAWPVAGSVGGEGLARAGRRRTRR